MSLKVHVVGLTVVTKYVALIIWNDILLSF